MENNDSRNLSRLNNLNKLDYTLWHRYPIKNNEEFCEIYETILAGIDFDKDFDYNDNLTFQAKKWITELYKG